MNVPLPLDFDFNPFLVVFHDGRVGRGTTVWFAFVGCLGYEEANAVTDGDYQQGEFRWDDDAVADKAIAWKNGEEIAHIFKQ